MARQVQGDAASVCAVAVWSRQQAVSCACSTHARGASALVLGTSQ
jgi:hypothetical protein